MGKTKWLPYVPRGLLRHAQSRASRNDLKFCCWFIRGLEVAYQSSAVNRQSLILAAVRAFKALHNATHAFADEVYNFIFIGATGNIGVY